jgi:UDP-N-acetylmuramoylalanine--D-glutamate ligase
MQRIVILGAGESGIGSAVLAMVKGIDVFVSDSGTIKSDYKAVLRKYSIPWEEGKHTEELIINASEVVKSPGIPDKAPIIKSLQATSIPVISEIEFAGRYTKAKTICITGSNGKTTTTLLIYHILSKAGLKVGLAGNVGKSFALQVAMENYDYYVIELSSFQLDGMFHFKADIAILLNITPDHLDRYDYNFKNYIKSKFRVTQNQRTNDVFIFCADDEVIETEMKNHTLAQHLIPFTIKKELTEGAWLEEEEILINYHNTQITMTIYDLALQGRHNVYNSMAAGIASNVLKIRKELIRESLSDFQGVEHRLENFLKVHGIQFINDSKATNINSSWYALESMTTPTIWIAGGVDKGNDYTELMELVTNKVKGIVCLGVDNTKLHEAFKHLGIPMFDVKTMKDAVAAAYSLGKKGDSVLLSPACASFDLFDNYEERGWKFKQTVRDL